MIYHVDHFGVDLEIRDRAFRVDVQMKCMEASVEDNEYISYDLDVRTYNLLADPQRNVPAYLFVVEVPKDQNEWTKCLHEGIHLRKCGYFAKISNMDITRNKATKTVHLPRINRLTVRSLDRLMKESRGVA